MPSVVLSDEGLQSWLRDEWPAHLETLGPPGPLECIDASHNSLTDDGVDYILDFLLQRKQKVKRIKFFHNRLREPRLLCRYLEDEVCGVGARDGIFELHLSHNLVTLSMMEQLLQSLSRRRQVTGPMRPPFWLRMEQNTALVESDAAQALADRENQWGGLKICFAGGMPRSKCTIKHCKDGCDVHLVLMNRR